MDSDCPHYLNTLCTESFSTPAATATVTTTSVAPMLSVPTFTPCRSLLGSGGGTTASFVLMMGTMFMRSSSCSVLFRFCLFWSSWKSRFVTRT